VEAEMSIEAMRQALEALADPWKSGPDGVASAITALRAAIERSEQPVAWMYDFLSDNEVIRDWVTQSQDDIKRENGFNVRPLYAAPRQWVGLTDEEKEDLYRKAEAEDWYDLPLVEAVEAKLKEKNA